VAAVEAEVPAAAVVAVAEAAAEDAIKNF